MDIDFSSIMDHTRRFDCFQAESSSEMRKGSLAKSRIKAAKVAEESHRPNAGCRDNNEGQSCGDVVEIREKCIDSIITSQRLKEDEVHQLS